MDIFIYATDDIIMKDQNHFIFIIFKDFFSTYFLLLFILDKHRNFKLNSEMISLARKSFYFSIPITAFVTRKFFKCKNRSKFQHITEGSKFKKINIAKYVSRFLEC